MGIEVLYRFLEQGQDAEALALLLATLTLLAASFGIVSGVKGLWRCARLSEKSADECPENDGDAGLKVSVIIEARGEYEHLCSYLDSLSSQTYRNIEPIIVYDGNHEAARQLADRVSARYPGVKVTFMPPGSRNVSRRKMSLTLGIKCAGGDVVLTTASNCRIPSERWIEKMMRPFASRSIEIVLGYTYIPFGEMRGFGKWYRQFDSIVTASIWIGAALAGKAFRGDGLNLAFRRKLFFDHKGYAGSYFLQNGEDDIFVNELSNKENTAVVVDSETNLSVDCGDRANREWRELKERHMFTRRWLPKMPFVSQSINAWSNWIALGCSLGALILWIFAMPGRVPAGWLASVLVLAVYWAFQIIVYRRAASVLNGVKLLFAVVPFMLWRPIADCAFSLRHRAHRKSNFTWQRFERHYILDFFIMHFPRKRRR